MLRASNQEHEQGLFNCGFTAMDFVSRNEDAAKFGKLPKHFPAHKPPDRFFANAQFSCAALHVERLTFDGFCCVHIHAPTRGAARTWDN